MPLALATRPVELTDSIELWLELLSCKSRARIDLDPAGGLGGGGLRACVGVGTRGAVKIACCASASSSENGLDNMQRGGETFNDGEKRHDEDAGASRGFEGLGGMTGFTVVSDDGYVMLMLCREVLVLEDAS